MFTMKHKTTSQGAATKVEPMPPAHVLETAPKEIADAVEALRAVNADAWAADRAVVEARKAERAEEIPSRRAALEDEVHAKEKEVERLAREARSTARSLAALLDENYEDLVRASARGAVERHVRTCDAYAALLEVTGTATRTPARQPYELADFVDPAVQARVSPGDFGAWLDETGVEAMLDRAGMTAAEAGLVQVVKKAQPFIRFLTTPARAAFLPSSEYAIEEV